MNKKICILTDTASTWTEQAAKDYGVALMPLNMIDSTSQEYFNNLSIEEINTRMLGGEILKTSTTPLGLILEIVTNLLKTYDQVIYLSISSKLSSQFSQAKLVVDEFQPGQFVVLDSQTGGYALELLTQLFVQLVAKNQLDLDQAEKIITDFNALTLTYFTCENIKYIARSGRGGKKILKYFSKFMRPVILFTSENNLETIGRTLKSAIDKMVLAVSKHVQKMNAAAIEHLVIYNGMGSSDLIQEIIHKLVSKIKFDVNKIKVVDVPKVVFVHTGPETYGVTIKFKE